IFDEAQQLLEGFFANRLVQAPREQVVNATINKVVQSGGGLLASEEFGDVIRDAILEGGDGVEDGGARGSRERLDERRIGGGEQVVCISVNEALDSAAEKVRSEEHTSEL